MATHTSAATAIIRDTIITMSAAKSTVGDLARKVVIDLHACGYKILPREPTEEMQKTIDTHEPYVTYFASAQTLWQAMWDKG